MPLYTYICKSHGVFDAWRSMSDSAKPTSCPTCRRSARRAISAPALSSVDAATRKAHHINERSADQPIVGSSSRLGMAHGHSPGHSHGHGHGHGHGHAHGPSRPWMIGH